MRVKAIALNTFKEAVRNKIFYLLVFIGIFFILSGKFVSMLTIGDKIKVLKDVGLASINFISVLIAIFTGINLVYKEIDKKTIYNILSKPIARRDFIIGKFVGLSLTLFVAIFSMFLIFILFLYINSGVLELNLLYYFVMLYMELLIIVSITILFSSFSTPILSTIFTITLYLLGHVLWTFNEFKSLILSKIFKALLYAIYYILPNLEKFNIKNQLVMNQVPDFSLFINSFIYAVIYISAMLFLSIYIFIKREFQ